MDKLLVVHKMHRKSDVVFKEFMYILVQFCKHSRWEFASLRCEVHGVDTQDMPVMDNIDMGLHSDVQVDYKYGCNSRL